ncbi:MAG: hypothetical protein ACXVCY_15220 [Pseudobdellovibrionaceae bacterium]
MKKTNLKNFKKNIVVGVATLSLSCLFTSPKATASDLFQPLSNDPLVSSTQVTEYAGLIALTVGVAPAAAVLLGLMMSVDTLSVTSTGSGSLAKNSMADSVRKDVKHKAEASPEGSQAKSIVLGAQIEAVNTLGKTNSNSELTDNMQAARDASEYLTGLHLKSEDPQTTARFVLATAELVK